MRVRRPHLEEHAPGAVPAGELDQRAQQAPAEPLALQLRIDADVQYVRLVGGNAEHAVAEDAAVLVQDPRRVIGAQAVAGARTSHRLNSRSSFATRTQTCHI